METIRSLVQSYADIVSKNVRDIVPKTIMYMMVNKLKEFLQTDLLPLIYSAGDQNQLMEESQEAAERRDEMIRMYHACKDALHLLSDISTRTGLSLSAPGPGDWLHPMKLPLPPSLPSVHAAAPSRLLR